MTSITFMKIYKGTFNGQPRIKMAVDRLGQSNTRYRALYKRNGKISYDWRETDVFIQQDEINLLAKLSVKFLAQGGNDPVTWPEQKPKQATKLNDEYSEILDEVHEERINRGAWQNATMHANIGACKSPSQEDYDLPSQVSH